MPSGKKRKRLLLYVNTKRMEKYSFGVSSLRFYNSEAEI